MKKTFYSLYACVALAVCFQPVWAQDEEMASIGPDSRISVGISLGTLSYFGEIGYGTHKDLISFATERRSFAFTGHKRLSENFGVQGNLTFGNLSKSERSTLPERNMNFKSTIVHLDGQFVYHFDNDVILPYDVGAAPFVSAGIGFMYFNPKGDLTNEAGKRYYYWSDGNVMDKAENAGDANLAKELSRDFEYETKLDSAGAHANITLTFPVTLGLRFKIHEDFEADIKGSLHFTMSDYIDNFKNENDGGADMFSFIGFSFRYFLPE